LEAQHRKSHLGKPFPQGWWRGPGDYLTLGQTHFLRTYKGKEEEEEAHEKREEKRGSSGVFN